MRKYVKIDGINCEHCKKISAPLLKNKNISNSDYKKIYKMFGDNYNCINTIQLMLEEINEK